MGNRPGPPGHAGWLFGAGSGLNGSPGVFEAMYAIPHDKRTSCESSAAVLLLMSAAPRAAVDAQDQRSSGENPWSHYRLAPDAIQEIDLASDTAWTLSADDRPARPIKVTAGGWNSDRQEPAIGVDAVKDHVVYQRRIAIPAAAKGNAVKLLFGGCNYGAEVWLDERKVGEHHGPMTPFEVDLTGVAEPGRTHRLRVKAWHRVHYGAPRRSYPCLSTSTRA